MPFAHKLARRLAMLKNLPLGLAVLLLLSCEIPLEIPSDPTSASRVTISPQSALVRFNQMTSVAVQKLNSTGTAVTATVTLQVRGTAGGQIVSTLDSGMATVGRYRAPATAGRDTIIASLASGAADTAVIQVTPMPVTGVTVTPATATVTIAASVPFTAALRDSLGNTLTGRTVTWTSTSTAVASVNGTGVASALALGTSLIIATSEGVSDTSTLTVTAIPVATVTVTPATATIGIGQTTPFTATTRDAGGTVLTGRVITWSSTNTAIATVTNAGVARGVAAGSASIIATSEGKADTSVVTVIYVPVATVTVTPATANLAVGGTTTFTATTRDSAGGVLTGRTIAWTSTNTAVATVNTTGVASGVAAGTASIIATSEGKADTSVVTVMVVPVATVTVTPATATVTVGLTATFTATTRDSAGGVLTGRVITWSSTNAGVATVSATGVATGIAGGSASIIATSEGKADTAALTVVAPVATVTVTPATATVFVAGTATFTATTRDSAGTVLTGRVITWSSTNTGIATVTAAGVARGVAVGSASIIATSEGKADTSVVTVILAPVATVTVSPATASTTVGATAAFTATTRDSAGTVLTGRVIVWTSTNVAVATVAAGVATGVTAGSASIIATSEGKADTAALTVTAAPPPGALADPTLLTRATGQHPAAGTYGRNLAAGQTYVDPNSGATVMRLTSASVPASNGGMYHGYSEGGPNISQPWTGTDGLVYYTAKVGDWLVDIRYSTFTSLNWRRVNYSGEIGFAFSLNPATPRIAYLANGKRIDRYNTGTNAIENTGRFPWNIAAAGSSADWLQSQMNDTWIVAMLQSNHTIVAFRTSDGFERAITEGAAGVSIDEPHLDREFPVVYLSTNSSQQNKVVELETGNYIVPRDVRNPANGEFVNGDDHASPMRGKIVALTWMADGFIQVDRTGQVAMTGARSPSPTDWSGDWHQASQWVFNNPNEYFVADQWADAGNYPIYRGMIGFVSLAGDIRLVAASDATGTSYTDGGQPHPTLAPDGKFVMWVSNMNGSGRFDTFIARTPVR